MKTSYAMIPGIRRGLQDPIGRAPGDAMVRIGAALASTWATEARWSLACTRC